MEFIYLCWQPEKVNNKPIYKIGKTTRTVQTRIKEYKPIANLIMYTDVFNSGYIERELINIFKYTFKRKLKYGNEYFKGNSDEMSQIITDICNNYNEEKKLIFLKEMSNLCSDYSKLQIIDPILNKKEDIKFVIDLDKLCNDLNCYKGNFKKILIKDCIENTNYQILKVIGKKTEQIMLTLETAELLCNRCRSPNAINVIREINYYYKKLN